MPRLELRTAIVSGPISSPAAGRPAVFSSAEEVAQRGDAVDPLVLTNAVQSACSRLRAPGSSSPSTCASSAIAAASAST